MGDTTVRTDRRSFLKDAAGAAGLVFVGCSIAGAIDARAQRGAAAARRTVVVRGRRITTVDVHAHCAVPAANDLLRRAPAAPPAAPGSLLPPAGGGHARRNAPVGAPGGDVAVLSIQPHSDQAERGLSPQGRSPPNATNAAVR